MIPSVFLWGGLGIAGLALLLLVLWLIQQQRQIHRLWQETQHHLLQQVQHLKETLLQQHLTTQHQLNRQLQETHETVERVSRSLGRLEEATRQMQQLGQEIHELQTLLQPPQVRGRFGEYLLEHLLANVLPRHRYHLQYRFPHGDIADAVVLLEGNRLLVIDAKFPLESFHRLQKAESPQQQEQHRREFQRAVQRHIDAIARKYLHPEAHTLDFAFMYIPAEGVYYEAVVRTPEIFTYALEKRVIPVSPGTFYPYLLTLRLAFREAELHQRSQQVIRLLRELHQQMGTLLDTYRVLGRHLTNAGAKYQEVQSALLEVISRLETLEDQPDEPKT